MQLIPQPLLKPLLRSSAKPPGALVCAKPGTGKTWTAVQLTNGLALACKKGAANGGVPLVPVLIYVQRVSRMLEGRCDGPTTYL